MELSALPAPWTAVVPWARPWHRATDRRAMPRAAAGTESQRAATSTSAGLRCAPDAGAGWIAAAAAMAMAQARLLETDDVADDPWPRVVAQHGVHLAARRLRAAQRAVSDSEDLFWRID